MKMKRSLPFAVTMALAATLIPALPASADEVSLTYEEVPFTEITSYFLEGNEVASNASSVSIDLGPEIEALGIEELSVAWSLGSESRLPVADIPFSDPFVFNLSGVPLAEAQLGDIFTLSLSGSGIESTGSFSAQIHYEISEGPTTTLLLTESTASNPFGPDPAWDVADLTKGALSQRSVDVTWGDTITISGDGPGYFTAFEGGPVVELWFEDPSAPIDWPWGELFPLTISPDGSSFSFSLPPDFRSLYAAYTAAQPDFDGQTFEEFAQDVESGGLDDFLPPFLQVLNYDIDRPFLRFATLELNWANITDTSDAVATFTTSITQSCVSGVFTAGSTVTNTGTLPIEVVVNLTGQTSIITTLNPGLTASLSSVFANGTAWSGSVFVDSELADIQGGTVDCAPTGGSAPTVDRLAGADRFATAAEVARQYPAFDEGEGVVYIANGLDFPDALSAAPAAGFQDAPLLLTQRDQLPAVTRAEIERLSPELIVIAGGEGVVSSAVELELRTLAPQVRRDAGSNRYETSRELTKEAFGASGATTAFLATGRGFPDALSASAAAGTFSAPVILVDGAQRSIDAATVQLLQELGVTSVYIAGGTGVISQELQNYVAGLPFITEVQRLAGADRYQTSQQINGEVFTTAAVVYLAVGTGFADALAGAALASKSNAPLFVVTGDCVPSGVLSQIAALGATEVVLLGGTGALSTRVAALASC